MPIGEKTPPFSRLRVWQVVEAACPDDRASRYFDLSILTLIGLNVVAVVLESIEPLARDYRATFDAFDVLSVSAFTVELLVRLWACPADPRFAGGLRGRLRFLATPLALIDLAAILPMYFHLTGVVDLRMLRGVRLIRLVRVAKLARYSRAVDLIRRVLTRRRAELVLTFGVTIFLLLVSSCLIYFAEHDAQPDVFRDVPSTLWWSVATLTAVESDDTYPVTRAGKVIGSAVALLGIVFFALPAGILGSGFVEEAQSCDAEPPCCPHCGEELDRPP